jgi:predicted house-cleaning noncanonical NTP pyrophosphatase (MazG superfamily)
MVTRVLFLRDLRSVAGPSGDQLPLNPMIGTKAAGLLRFPTPWIPYDFAVVPALSPDQNDGRILAAAAEDILAGLARSSATAPLIVRSSGANESMRVRGAYRTEVCVPTASALVLAMQHVIASFRDSGRPERLFSILVHEHITSKQTGHLSNERRVGSIRSFIGEMWTGEEAELTSTFTLQSKKEVAQPGETTPIPIVDDNVEHALRQLARWVHKHIGRAHLEWIVHDDKLVVVQCDIETGGDVPEPMSIWKIPVGSFDPDELKVLKIADRTNSADLRKTSSRLVFRDCSLSIAPLYLLRERAALEAIIAGAVPADVSHDLSQMSAFPFVIRIDVVTEGNEDWENLPASTVLRTEAEASEFLLRGLPAARERVRRTEELAVVVHHFIAARAAAWAEAVPASGRVRIDATWGHPDGLQGFPCDSVYMSFPENQHYEFRRFKDEYLDVDESGKTYRRINGAPWDKQPVLDDRYSEEIASKTLVVANHLSRPVRIMWFVGTVAQTASMPKCFPWILIREFQATADQFLAGHREAPLLPKGDTVSQARRLAIGTVRRIETETDIGDLETSAQEFDLGGRRVLLRPEANLVRSKGFLKSVADAASRGRWRLVLEGSTLAHAFYLLRSMGVDVESASEYLAEPRRRKIYRKLVRDLIPQHILARGEIVDFRKIPRGELKPALLRKLTEETSEAVAANSDSALMEELADVLEVVRALAEECGGGLGDVTERADRKRRRKGGFEAGYELVATGGTGSGLTANTRQLELFGK